MRLGRTQSLLVTGALAASFLPWALKPLAVGLAYLGVLQGRSFDALTGLVLRSRFIHLTLAYWFALLLSATWNGTPAASVLGASLAIVVTPVFAVVAGLPVPKQRELMTGFVLAAFVYTARYAVTFDWSQLLNPDYRGDKDADVFVALNGGLIFAWAAERLLFGADSRRFRTLLMALAAYGLLVVLIIKSRGTLAALLATALYLGYRYLRTSRNRKRTGLVLAMLLLAVAAAVAMLDLARLGGGISDLLHLTGDGTRSLSTGSGRFLVWDYALKVLWPEEFWLGHGPGANLELIYDKFSIHGAHNVVVATIVDGGLVAAIPLLAILLLPIAMHRRKAGSVFGYQFYFLALAAALNESLLFSFGNPFAWVNLIMYAQLCGFGKDKDADRHRRP